MHQQLMKSSSGKLALSDTHESDTNAKSGLASLNFIESGTDSSIQRAESIKNNSASFPLETTDFASASDALK